MSNLRVCAAVLNFNGIDHLKHLLPSLRDATQQFRGQCAVVVLDNQSTDGSTSWIAEHYPEVEIVSSPANDFLFSFNWLLARREEDVAILLNNDLRVEKNFIAPLIRHFDRPEVFAASCKTYSWDGLQVMSGITVYRFSKGWLSYGFDQAQQARAYTFFCSGACVAVDRQKFVQLGGFDRLFYPAYGEDVDLSFRGWSCGWRSIYEPASVVYHRESASWAQTADDATRFHIIRAMLLFQWRNVSSSLFRCLHSVRLLWLRARKTLEGDAVWLRAYRAAASTWDKHRSQEGNKRSHLGWSELHRWCGRPLE